MPNSELKQRSSSSETTNDQKASRVSEKKQSQVIDTEKNNNEQQASAISAKKQIQPIDKKKNNNDQQTPKISENNQLPAIDRQRNKKVCQASQGKAPEMVIIPAGSFMMGSLKSDNNASEDEKPQHQVTIKRPFAIGRCELSFADYQLFTKATGRNLPSDEGWGRNNYPVINISWEDAQAYVRWLSLATGRRYRLPTEAEWEYAARGKRTDKYYWDAKQDINDFAWTYENSDNKAHPVGEKIANQFGLYDTAGNVWGWVQDCWHGDYTGAPADGSAWGEADKGNCGRRVLRGGSWYSVPWSVRSATRDSSAPGARFYDIGFRLAQDLN